MKSLGQQIKQARLQRHMSQSALAQQVGCKQSALSMFEGGQSTALNRAVIEKLCQQFGLVLPAAAEYAEVRTVAEGPRCFCPNEQCPSNLPYTLEGRALLVPRKHLMHAGECHCSWCGEVLEKACPECGAPVNGGAFCAACGSPYVQVVGAPRTVHAEQAQQLMAWSE